MDFRNKRLVMVIRILFGLFMTFSGVSGLMAGSSLEGIPAPMVETMKVLLSTGIFHMIKVTEIVAGLMLVFNFLPALAAIFLAPVSVGIVVFNLMLQPMYAIMGVVVCLFNGYFGFVYWEKYKALFSRK
ncbi:DoxX family membrane protein [Candidatus Woesearchaeota archaeon]|nr:DoxX family membrane protein [Candidatus Woesearchaeota archaeon]